MGEKSRIFSKPQNRLVQFAYTPKEVFALASTHIRACWVGPQRARKTKNNNLVIRVSEQGFLDEFILILNLELVVFILNTGLGFYFQIGISFHKHETTFTNRHIPCKGFWSSLFLISNFVNKLLI